MQSLIPHSRPWIKPDDRCAVDSLLRERAVSDWKYTPVLAQMLCEYSGLPKARLYATGTLALAAALKSLELSLGSGIGIPSYTCSNVLEAVVIAGYTPIVLDCRQDATISETAISEAISKGKVKAVIAVHQFGLFASGAKNFCNEIQVIEDCSHVPPRQYLPGSYAVCGSLEGTKLLGSGEGGYLLGKGSRIERFLEMSGQDIYNSYGARLSDIIACIAINQLNRIEENLKRREKIATNYTKSCTSLGINMISGERISWFRFLIKAKDEKELARWLEIGEKMNICLLRPIMPKPLHALLPGIGEKNCPISEELYQTTLSIPIYPDLSVDDRSHIIKFLRSLPNLNL
ncbi:MAG: UDP-4-amino-4-deoxy-L-arabinose--oxoglutarate aminotransferase [Pelotomaculum sp. PtaU1.Bin065]|nr:MAG: UDP-4-amino-4-deoxy-L-arabinose--oxoglutarate aminotransferase [Pelotomaculum sp. PtaU1.Bin065]